MLLSTVTPVHYGANATASLTLAGSGFTNSTTIALVGADGTAYPASAVAFDTFTQITATIDLSGVPQGIYSIRATNAGGGSYTLPSAFTIMAPGPANLQTHLILPAAMGRHVSSTIYVQYSNTGAVAMPAPLLVLESARLTICHSSRSMPTCKSRAFGRPRPRPCHKDTRRRLTSSPAAEFRACWSRASR